MPKNLVVCCDGTGSTPTQGKTNVARLYEAVEQDGAEQVGFYGAGVGTFGPFGWRLAKPIGKLMGAAFGYGVKQNVEQAYRFLLEQFEPGDRVFLFGFSRGAFTVRSLAGMLHKCGLLYASNEHLLSRASDTYFERDNDATAARFKRAYCRECKPRFLGVWDTVASLGWLLSLRTFHDTRLNPDVAHGYHAVAIDERRPKFAPSLWDESALQPHQDVRQVWFAGVHSDVGGGYPERGLGDVTLAWILDAAAEQGLRMNREARAALEPDPLGMMHESYRGLWRLLGREPRAIPGDARIHESVFVRLEGDTGYAPANLPRLNDVTTDDATPMSGRDGIA